MSIFALQLAKTLGARVIATTRSSAGGDILRSLDADEIVNTVKCPQWGDRVRELTEGLGVDCVVEVGGPATINQSLRSVAWGGDVVLIGFLTAENPGIDFFDLLRSGATVRAVSVGDRANLEELVRAVSMTGLKPVIDRVFAFEAARDAFIHLKSAGRVGKTVIRL